MSNCFVFLECSNWIWRERIVVVRKEIFFPVIEWHRRTFGFKILYKKLKITKTFINKLLIVLIIELLFQKSIYIRIAGKTRRCRIWQPGKIEVLRWHKAPNQPEFLFCNCTFSLFTYPTPCFEFKSYSYSMSLKVNETWPE